MRRLPTCHLLRSASADRQDSRSLGWSTRASSNTLNGMDFTCHRPHTNPSLKRRGIPRQAECMAKAERRPKHVLPAQVRAAVAAAEDKKAADLVVLDLRKATGFTDFFVICSGTKTRQIRAIAD